MELNPNHTVTDAIRQHWQKLLALLVLRNGGHVVLTLDELRQFPADMAIAVQEKDDGLHLRTLPLEEAKALARREGGLPT